MSTQHEKHAIVIGAGIAGLLAVRVLSDHFDRVTLLEADDISKGHTTRKGVPQQHHIHTLLAKGREILENLYPGLDAELANRDVPLLTWGKDTRVLTTGGYVQSRDTGIQGRAHSRNTLETVLRERTLALENVTLVSETRVVDLLHESDRIVGVRIGAHRDKHSLGELYGDLVVDASGRQSQTPDMLKRLGYPTPEERSVDPLLGYSTRWYRRPAAVSLDVPAMLIQPGVIPHFYRGAAAAQAEADQVVITLVGVNGDYPPTDEDGFRAFAQSLPDPTVARWINELKPVSPIHGFRAANRMRHYERLEHSPEGFIVLGDAFCVFNPIYGQGMTVAAQQAVLLDRLLRRWQGSRKKGFARRFHRKLARQLMIPWLLATGEDSRYPLTEGSEHSLVVRLLHRYLDRVFIAAAQDSEVALSFLKVMQMLAHPIILFKPHILKAALQARRSHEFELSRPEMVGSAQWSQSSD